MTSSCAADAGERRPDAPATAPVFDVRFAITNLNPLRVEGWAFSHGRPDQPVRVLLQVDGQVVAEQTARLHLGAVAEADGVPPHCGFSFDIAPYFSGGGDKPVEFAFDLAVGGRRGTATRRRVSRDGALLHYFFTIHLRAHPGQSALLRTALNDLVVALGQPPLTLGVPGRFAAPAAGALERAARLNAYLAHHALCEGLRAEFLLDDDALFDFLFAAFEGSVYRNRVNLVPVDGELADHCAATVRRVGGHIPVPRILEHFTRRFVTPAPDAPTAAPTAGPADGPTDGEEAHGAALHAFIQAALAAWRLPPRLLGDELLALFLRPVPDPGSETGELPYAVRLAARHDETLRGVFDTTTACDRLGLTVLVLLRLARAGLHRDLLPAGTIEALTRPGAVPDEPDGVLALLCRQAGVPDVTQALRDGGGTRGMVRAYTRPPARPAGGGEAGPVRLRVIGNLAEAGGLRKNLDNSLAALRRAGIPAELVDARVLPAATHLDGAGRWINLFHVAPAALPRLLMMERPELVSRAYNIGYFMWETEEVPRSFDLALGCVDEVWTGSSFCAAAFARRFAGPVVNMLHAVEPPPPCRPLPRAHFGLPEDAFCFHFAFDAKALFGRKNPLLTALAFRRAFPADEAAVLAIKIRNVADATLNPANRPYWKSLRAVAAQDPRIRLIAQDFPAAEMQALQETADCYVSLHRAEGFGYTMAEAMLAGKPVIASRYSGNLDFMDDGTALLVDGTLAFIGGEDGFGDPGGRWFEADLEEAARLMRRVRTDPGSVRGLAAAGQARARLLLSAAALEERYVRRLAEIAKETSWP